MQVAWAFGFNLERRQSAGGAPCRSLRCERMKGAMTFVVPGDRDGAESQRPETIVDFFKRDRFAGQRGGDKQRRIVPRNAAVARDEADFHVAGILERGQVAGPGAPRRLVTT